MANYEEYVRSNYVKLKDDAAIAKFKQICDLYDFTETMDALCKQWLEDRAVPKCRTCHSILDEVGYCPDEACLFHQNLQEDVYPAAP